MVLAASALAPRVRSNMAIIRAGVARGQSVAQINADIRLTGQLGIRRVDLLAGVRQVKGQVETGLHLENIGRSRLPDPSRMTVARTPILRNYSFDMKITVRDKLTGVESDRYVTIRTDSNLSALDREAQAKTMWEAGQDEEKYRENEEYVQSRTWGGRRKGV